MGDDTRYSTHLENPDDAYQAMKDEQALTVEIDSAGTTQTYTFTLAELENILYGAGVSKSDRDNEGRQDKGYYYYKSAGNGAPIEDLFEGVDLDYLLTEQIGLQGTLGTVELYSGGGSEPSATYDLAAIGDKGYNSLRGTDGLGMTVAFAKNGYPLVSGSTAAGYVDTDTVTHKTIKNSGGPLQFVRAQTAEENAVGSIDTSDGAKTSVENLTKIVVNLEPDRYAHVGLDNEALANQQIAFSGAVAKTDGVSISVGDLEKLQKYMVTDAYTVAGVSDTYRGLDLYKLLRDKSIGASALMDEITVTNGSDSVTIPVADLIDGVDGQRIILAYGSGAAGSETPLGSATGPLRLILPGGSEADCVTHVSEIAVSAANLTAWKHDFGQYAQYGDNTLEISGQNLAHNQAFTVAQLEDMDNIIVSDTYKIDSTTTAVVQGVDLYKLLQNIGFAGDLDTSVFTAYASDGYSTQFSTASYLKDGINGKPILVAFGQGPSETNGLPLVPDTTSSGYDPNVGNAYGPLRLMVNDNSGWSVKYLVRIVVGAAGGNPDPATLKAFNMYGLKGGAVGYTIDELKNLPDGLGTQIDNYSYTSGGAITDCAQGAYLYDLLKTQGVSDLATVTVNCTDSFETGNKGASYCNIPMSEIKEQKYFVAYAAGPDEDDLSAISDNDKQAPPVTATVRIYRNYDDGTDWLNRLTNIKGVTVADYSFSLYPGGINGIPNASLRAVAPDSAGGLWVGSYGGGAAYISASGEITSYTTDTTPALKTNYVTGIAIAPDGGVWLTQGGNPGSETAAWAAQYGFSCFKDGAFTFYDTGNSGIPSNCVYGIDVGKDGNVWLASQYNSTIAGGDPGGLTRFDPATGASQTWTTADGLPTTSAWAVKADDKGGAWVTTHRNAAADVDPPDESYAYVSAAGEVTSYPVLTPNDLTWSRSVAIGPNGGAYITYMSGANDPTNTGGWLDYIAPDGSVTSYSGDSLIPDLKSKAYSGFYPEIRTVFVDAKGNLWLTTNGLGVYRCTVSASGDISVDERYSSASGSWPAGPFDDVWSIYVSPDGQVIFGSNGGVAVAKVDLTPVSPPTPPGPAPITSGQPVLVVTGDGIIAGGTYTAGNISNEKSYTLDELQALPGL
ncbi:MAG: hypothetical protein FWF44_09420, partial [Defluviitaleaceae bacterium]|nr:hypothetical protein [Defluviitaleaceae bacterium]